MDKNATIYVVTPGSFLGRSIVRSLERDGYTRVLSQLGIQPDCRNRASVDAFFSREKPEYVFLAGGKSAGIMGNTKYPADLMLDNLLIECNLIDGAYRAGVKKLLYLASSCSYPKHCPQPMKEEFILTGLLEPTNEAYAVAKIAGIKLCQAYRQQYGSRFIVVIPANAFGFGDDFSSSNSHVVAALLRRFHEAKLNRREGVEIWGTGSARRDFIFVRDLADACVFVMNQYEGEQPINIGGGSGLSIAELARAIKAVSGFSGRIEYDASKPDGMPVKVLDSGRLRALGWRRETRLPDALQETYDWYLEYGRHCQGEEG